jgi:hypothetical protein
MNKKTWDFIVKFIRYIDSGTVTFLFGIAVFVFVVTLIFMGIPS